MSEFKRGGGSVGRSDAIISTLTRVGQFFDADQKPGAIHFAFFAFAPGNTSIIDTGKT
ncbi:hypothetical protein [Herbaspirillum camelliae]|uniref:hypothetical protein n=1 Tax=Herbaspirillum camelliae TaxID=1892903 RepID=UPI001301356B|nr:hypothetical protein [Herbaspirillum camelliae]